MKKSTTPNIQFKLTEAENETLQAKATGRPDGLSSDWYKSMFLAGLAAFKPIKKAPVKAEVKVAKKVAAKVEAPVSKTEVKAPSVKKAAKVAAPAPVEVNTPAAEVKAPVKKIIAKKSTAK